MKEYKGKPIILVMGMAAAAGIGAAGQMFSAFTQDAREKRANENAKDAAHTQFQNQRSLNKQGQALGMQTWRDTSYGAQMNEMEKAGLSEGLMYGGGGAGGGTVSSPSGGSAGKADTAGPQQLDIGAALIGSQMNALNAKAKKDTAEAETIDQSREGSVEKLTQEGMKVWFENNMRRYSSQATGSDGYNRVIPEMTSKLYGMDFIHDDSMEIQQIRAEILQKAMSGEASLSQSILADKRARVVWEDLLVAQKNADSKAIEAAAKKLAIEWGTGEFTNWKTWVETGESATKIIGNIMGAGKMSKGSSMVWDK